MTHRNTTTHQWFFASVIIDSWLLRNIERLSVMSLRTSGRRQELDSDATLAFVEPFDSNYLPEVITVAAVWRRVIGERH